MAGNIFSRLSGGKLIRRLSIVLRDAKETFSACGAACLAHRGVYVYIGSLMRGKKEEKELARAAGNLYLDIFAGGGKGGVGVSLSVCCVLYYVLFRGSSTAAGVVP